MNFILETQDTPEFLRIVISGVLDESNSEMMVDDFIAALTASKQHRVLLDTTKLAVQTSLIQDYHQAEYAAVKLIGIKHKIANLINQESLDSDEFFETVSVNRGMQIAIFKDEKDAINYLIDDVS